MHNQKMSTNRRMKMRVTDKQTSRVSHTSVVKLRSTFHADTRRCNNEHVPLVIGG